MRNRLLLLLLHTALQSRCNAAPSKIPGYSLTSFLKNALVRSADAVTRTCARVHYIYYVHFARTQLFIVTVGSNLTLVAFKSLNNYPCIFDFIQICLGCNKVRKTEI